MLLCVANVNNIIKYQMSSANITPQRKGNCMKESTPIHLNLLWVLFLIIPLAICFIFSQYSLDALIILYVSREAMNMIF